MRSGAVLLKRMGLERKKEKGDDEIEVWPAASKQE